jgi:membrane protease YdiL (CAAX protease family)
VHRRHTAHPTNAVSGRRTAPDADPPRSTSGREVATDLALGVAPIVLLGGLGSAIGLTTVTGLLLINVGYVLAIAVAGWRLRVRGTHWRLEGLAAPRSLVRTVVYAVAAWVAAVAVIVAVQLLAPLLPITLPPIDESRFDGLVGNIPLLVVSLAAAWTTIAFGEELMFRGFLIGRLHALWRGRIGAAVAVVVAAALFGVAHLAEGPLGVLSNGAFGALFGAIYLASGRNLWITIGAHGLLNTLRFVLVFVGAA